MTRSVESAGLHALCRKHTDEQERFLITETNQCRKTSVPGAGLPSTGRAYQTITLLSARKSVSSMKRGFKSTFLMKKSACETTKTTG